MERTHSWPNVISVMGTGWRKREVRRKLTASCWIYEDSISRILWRVAIECSCLLHTTFKSVIITEKPQWCRIGFVIVPGKKSYRSFEHVTVTCCCCAGQIVDSFTLWTRRQRNSAIRLMSALSGMPAWIHSIDTGSAWWIAWDIFTGHNGAPAWCMVQAMDTFPHNDYDSKEGRSFLEVSIDTGLKVTHNIHCR